MRKYKFKKQSLDNFFQKHGFTLAMGIGVLGLGLAVWSAVDTMRSTGSDGTGSVLPAEQIVENVTVTPTPSPTCSPTPTVAPTLSPTVSPTPEPTVPALAYPEYFLFPVSGTVTNEYSDSLPVFSETMGDWRVHNGIDIAATAGETVTAVAEGEVLSVCYDEAWGTVVEVNHGGGLTAKYCCLSEEVSVKEGDTLSAGDAIGTVGTAGYEECAEGPHLHLEMTFAGKNVDPVIVMEKKTS